MTKAGSGPPGRSATNSFSRQKLRRAEAIACVRLKREQGTQNLGFTSRPIVLCGLPVRKPKSEELLHERRNGDFLLQVTGHPAYGLPSEQDRLVPLFLATLAIRQQNRTIRFRSAAEMLGAFVCNRAERNTGG